MIFFLGGGGGGGVGGGWGYDDTVGIFLWGASQNYFWELFLNLRFRYRIGIFLGGC